jgi:hypothetical protein
VANSAGGREGVPDATGWGSAGGTIDYKIIVPDGVHRMCETAPKPSIPRD